MVVGGLQTSARSQKVPSSFFFKAFMDRGREKSCCAALQHTQSFRQQVDSWAMVTGQVLTCKGGQQASHHDVQAELPKRLCSSW